MTEDASVTSASTSLATALSEYLDSLKPQQRRECESPVRKFVDHMGYDLPCASLTAARVELYGERQITPLDPNAADRVGALKQFFVFLKKKGYIPENYGARLRVPRNNRRAPGTPPARVDESPLEMTADGLQARKQELERLQSLRPSIVQAIATAREDKDFRENAPLQAAREQLGMTDGRIKQLEGDIRRAVVIDASAAGDASAIGSIVTVTQAGTARQIQFTLVGSREANAAERRISVESPVGRQLLGRRVGDEVEVVVPSGTVVYHIDEIRPS